MNRASLGHLDDKKVYRHYYEIKAKVLKSRPNKQQAEVPSTEELAKSDKRMAVEIDTYLQSRI